MKTYKQEYDLHNMEAMELLMMTESDSVDGMVTDPPAGIGFMNKEWDKDKGGRDAWITWMQDIMAETMRVLKPGAHALVWALPRTSHWTATALENAGFEVRDCVYHLQSQGFPKSFNVSKGIDKRAGLQKHESTMFNHVGDMKSNKPQNYKLKSSAGYHYQGKDDLAKTYQGYGSQLKPAMECWWLVRKPLSEKSIVDNVLKHGTGALNIDASRIATEDKLGGGAYTTPNNKGTAAYAMKDGRKTQPTNKLKPEDFVQPQGRFPSNFIHDGSDAVMAEFDKYGNKKSNSATYKTMGYQGHSNPQSQGGYDDNGTIARYFYCAKTSVGERNLAGSGNTHPTIKPVKLMSYLVNLIMPPITKDYTPVILDPFMGSGSTGIAALLNGYDFIGIELDKDYYNIATQRISNYELYRKYM